MFSKRYEQRLAAWHNFRKDLETNKDPIQTTINLYQTAPRVSINCDPWDPKTWPNPWELIQENEYCEYCILLGICYTLQLTDNFNDKQFEIHIGIDRQNTERYYLLHVDNRVIGYDEVHVDKKEIPASVLSETVHVMPSLQ